MKMKLPKMIKKMAFAMLTAHFLSFAATPNSHAQTTLSGDHVITGDLNVGTSGTAGSVQIQGETGNLAAPGLKITGDGGVVFTGNFGVGTLPSHGAGPSFLWYPKKAAIRVGPGVISDAMIGNRSAAFGYGTASGPDSVAFGGYASGANSIAIGNSEASGYFAVSIGDFSWASGENSLASGFFSNAYGYHSTAVGYFSEAYGDFALSYGDASLAEGSCSLAFGASHASGSYSSAIGRSRASGWCATALGEGWAMGVSSFSAGWSMAFGSYSTSFGFRTNASSHCGVAIGKFNKIEGSATAWVETDPLFSVGNGTGNLSDPPEVRYRNAFTIKKNGAVEITGPVTMPRQGDILMGEFGGLE